VIPGLTIVQVAMVVADLEAHAARLSAAVGAGPWRVYEFGPHMIDNYVMRGEPATGRTLLALSDAHPQLELLQPLGGTSAHQEWLDTHGEGMHHVGAVVESVDDAVATAAGHGIGVISSGEGFGRDGSGKFAYLDSQKALGMIVEVFEPPTALGEPARRL
jgi:methylmalonyl-CoA/ethylmalonyl-CoA epimerase